MMSRVLSRNIPSHPISSSCGVKWNFIIKDTTKSVSEKKHCMINNNKRRSRWKHFVHLRISIFCGRFYLLFSSNLTPRVFPRTAACLPDWELVHYYLWTTYYYLIQREWGSDGRCFRAKFWESVKLLMSLNNVNFNRTDSTLFGSFSPGSPNNYNIGAE